jgi:hypothetical protein
MLKTETSGSLIFRLCGSSLVVMRSVGGMYRMGSRLLSCPFLHSESFNPLGAFRVVLILACCQSVVLSTSLLKEDFSGTQPCAWWLVKKFAEHKNSWSKKTLTCADSTRKTSWKAWYIFFYSCKNIPLNMSRVLNSKCPQHFAK